MSDPKPQPTLRPASAPTSVTPLSTRGKLQQTYTSELVIALCGPIGSPIHEVGEKIKEVLDDKFAYGHCEVIRLSEFIRKYDPSGTPIPTDEHGKIKELIRRGDVLRKNKGPSVLVELAIGTKITKDREARKVGSGASNYEPARVCHIIDSVKNQEELELLRKVYRDMLYFVGVYSPIEIRQKNLERRGMSLPQIYELIDRDSWEELDHGQTVRDTFPQADFFLRIDNDSDSKLTERVSRFLEIILGTKIITPNKAEKAMYAAASAAGNSACLSRQVGAAITDATGEILATGWNDVPKFGGNLYGNDNETTSSEDLRCWNLEGGVCFNDREKKQTAEIVVTDLIAAGLVTPANRAKALEHVSKSSKLRSLIEFSRSVHAETHAIIVASQTAGERVKGGKLFCTTYPCHGCARLIIAAGIEEVYYIEPYRKSLATKLHSDALSENERDTQKVRILPYDGVAPNKYLKLFREVPGTRKDSSGKMEKVNPKAAYPRFDNSLESLPALEALVVQSLAEKELLEPNGNERQTA
jgi:deoxycytidylate deaminase